MCCGGGGGGKCILFMRKKKPQFSLWDAPHDAWMRKVRKEFLSGAQNKRCMPRLRDELTALMFVSKKLRQQNMMSNTGTTKVPLIAHRNKVLNFFPLFLRNKNRFDAGTKKNSWKMCLRLYAVIFTWFFLKNISINYTCNKCDPIVIRLLKFCNYCNYIWSHRATIMHCVTVKQKLIIVKKKTELTPAFVHFTMAWTKTRLRCFLQHEWTQLCGKQRCPCRAVPGALAHRAGVRRWDRALSGHGAGNNTPASTEDIVFPE